MNQVEKTKVPKLKITYPDGLSYDLTPHLNIISLDDCCNQIIPIPSCEVIRWGSFSMNFWFNCSSGYGWKAAAAYAKRRLEHLACGYSNIEIIY